MTRLLAAFFVLLTLASAALAHDARPAYLEIRELPSERYEVLWRTPVLAGNPLAVVVKFPEAMRNVTEPRTQQLSDSMVERWVIELPGGLAGRRIEFPGLQAVIADVLVRVQGANGSITMLRARPSQPWVEMPAAPGTSIEIAGAFVGHGIQHILFGYDHLLFVLALMLIVRDAKAIVLTVTAFTLAHSLTLALSTLGVVRVPGPPVEAAIALSIVFVAAEIVRLRAGEGSLTASRPWLIAFCFGLLHGFGFASALSEIGLPHGDVPLALFAFNVGVELGQLAFVGAVLAAVAVARRARLPDGFRHRAARLAPYGIGSLAAFWFVERVAAFAQ